MVAVVNELEMTGMLSNMVYADDLVVLCGTLDRRKNRPRKFGEFINAMIYKSSL